MELREWQYMNKPASNSSGSSKTNKDKFITLMYNMMKNKLPSVTDAKCVRVDDSGFTYKETSNNATLGEYTLTLLVGYNKDNSWKYELYIDTTLAETRTGDGMKELIHWLNSYFGVPAVGTKEYQSLTEWVVMKNNSNTSAGYKKRFEKLIKYHIDHASSELESITKKDIKDDSFRLSEHYNNGHHEFDRDIVVSYDKDSDTFMLRIFVDGKEVDNILRKGYEDFVDAAEDYMFLPDSGTQEYDDLLTESLNEWQLMNPPKASQSASTTSSKTNKEKFAELLQYMVDHKLSTVVKTDISKLDEDGFTYRELRHPVGLEQAYELATIVNYGYGKNNSSWQVSVYKSGRNIDVFTGEGWDELLGALDTRYNVPARGSIEYKSICESASSIADDFKLYENLWD